MGVYVKTTTGADKIGKDQSMSKAVIVYNGYHVLTYLSSKWLQTTIAKGTIDSTVFEKDTAPTILITPRFYSGMPYQQITGYGYDINISAQTITLYAIGGGFVSGHLQAISVAVLANI